MYLASTGCATPISDSMNRAPTNPREDKVYLVPTKIATEMSLPQRARKPRPYIGRIAIRPYKTEFPLRALREILKKPWLKMGVGVDSPPLTMSKFII